MKTLNKCGKMLPSTYVIGIIVFGMVIAGIVSMYSIVGSDLNGNTTRFNSTFNILDKASNSTTNMQTKLEGSSQDWGLWGVLNALIGSAWETFKLLFTSFGFMTIVFHGLEAYGIPSWFTTGIIAIILAIIVFAIMSAILKAEA